MLGKRDGAAEGIPHGPMDGLAPAVDAYMASESIGGELLSDGVASKSAVVAHNHFVGKTDAQAEPVAMQIEPAPVISQPASAPGSDSLLGGQPSNVPQQPDRVIPKAVGIPPVPPHESTVEAPPSPVQQQGAAASAEVNTASHVDSRLEQMGASEVSRIGGIERRGGRLSQRRAQVAGWVRGINLGQCAAFVMENGVDGDALLGFVQVARPDIATHGRCLLGPCCY